MKNPEKMLQTDPIAKEMLAKYKVPMPNQNLSDEEVREYIAYFKWADANLRPQVPSNRSRRHRVLPRIHCRNIGDSGGGRDIEQDERQMSAKVFAALICMWPLLAWSCGVCDEDKVAATYDHGVISRAAAARQTVVFVTVNASVEPQAFARRVASVAPRVRGVLRGSVRTAIAPVAFSFVLDPAVQTP